MLRQNYVSKILNEGINKHTEKHPVYYTVSELDL